MYSVASMALIYLFYEHYKILKNYKSTRKYFPPCVLSRYLFCRSDFPLYGDVRDVRVSTLIWHLPRRSRCFESGETLHKSNEEHVHRQTKCHQSDHLPGFRSKTETSRNLAHICFLWRQRTKVMKSLTREAERDGGREREKQESRWFQLESYR